MKQGKSVRNPGTIWGWLAVINLHDCDEDLIKDRVALRCFVVELCDLIDMKMFGPTHIERFGYGDLEGCSLMQFIETSSINVHCDETESRVFIEIHSCKEYDAEVAEQFCAEFFRAASSNMNVQERR